MVCYAYKLTSFSMLVDLDQVMIAGVYVFTCRLSWLCTYNLTSHHPVDQNEIPFSTETGNVCIIAIVHTMYTECVRCMDYPNIAPILPRFQRCPFSPFGPAGPCICRLTRWTRWTNARFRCWGNSVSSTSHSLERFVQLC